MRPAAAVLAFTALAACAGAPAPRSAGPAALAAPAPDEGALALRCERGFAPECRDLGRARLLASPPDVRLGAALLTKACEIGDAAGCSDLGVLYAIGRGVAQSDERAAALARRACEQGSAIGCSNQGALLAEGTLPPGEPREALDARILRLFRAACDAGVPEGCTNLGTALDGDELAARDVRAAGRAYRRACDAGFALACHRLAALVAERPEAAPDLTGTSLEARACRAGGVAPACYAVGDPTAPVSARTPAARLVDAAGTYALGIPGAGGFSPGELSSRSAAVQRRALGELERPPVALQAALPPDLRMKLGMGLPAREGAAADPPVDLLVALRRHELGQCEEARAGERPAADGFAVFFVDGDGRAAEVRTATAPADRALEACLREVVAGWEFPASPGGIAGPYLARHAFEAAAAPAPALAGPGTLRPALRDPACVEHRLAVPAEYRGSTGAVLVKLAVDAKGAPGLVHALAPVPDPLLVAVVDAVRACPWSPGAGEDGRRATLWTTLTVRIEGR